MAKNQDILYLDEFKGWLKGNVSGHVVSNYSSWLKKIDRDFISGLNTGSKDTPFGLLKKYINTASKSGPNANLVSALLLAIKSCINKRKSELAESKSSGLNEFSCERSAFSSYSRFIDEYVSAMPHRNCPLTQTQDAAIISLNGNSIMLEKDDLIGIFASRINSQDRNTGDKTFFPLGLIARILPRGTVREWAKEEAENVRIHLRSGYTTVSEIANLTIDTATKEVYVSFPDGRIERVYEPELNGLKTPMFLRQIKDTDLDHEPEIHTILQDMKGTLPGLDLLTVWIKKKQKQLGYKTINNKNYDKICNALYVDKAFQAILTEQVKKDILRDLEKVSEQHVLQLTSYQWNRSKKKQAKKK